MKVTIDIPNQVLEPALQIHLEKGVSVQEYIIKAIAVFNILRKAENEGKMAGYGDKSRFRNYNTQVNLCIADEHYLENKEEEESSY